MAVLVTGACGWIGGEVCSFLAGKGTAVIGADLAEADGPWESFLPMDITQPVDASAGGIDTVIHCAGYAHRPNETLDEQKMFYSVNRDGTRNLLDWCERNGIQRFLYVGSIASYDWQAASGPVGEDHPMKLETHYARSKHEGELLVAASNLDWRIVRLATVFGEGDRANFARMAAAMKKRLFLVPGQGTACKSVIPVQLAAELVSEFALMERPPYRLVNLALPEAPSLAAICDAYRGVCGFSATCRLPMWLARLLGFFGDVAAKLLGRFPFTTATLGKLTLPTVVSTERMQACFPEKKFDTFAEYLKLCKEHYISL